MLKTNDYSERIFALYNQGKCGKQIADILHFKYHQPIYNFFRKHHLKNNPTVYKRKYTLDENFFKCINTPEKAYILGFVCADGHISHDRLIITLATKDVDILHKIKFFMNSSAPIKNVIKVNPYLKSKNKIVFQSILQLNSRELVKPLFNMGLTSDKTYTLDRGVLKVIPKFLMRDFLRGYFDGDGNILWRKRYSSGVKYNINICGNQDFLLGSFNTFFPSKNKLYKDLYSKQCYIWKLSSKDNVYRFLKYLYHNSSIFLLRKYKIYLIARGHVKQG